MRKVIIILTTVLVTLPIFYAHAENFNLIKKFVSQTSNYYSSQHGEIDLISLIPENATRVDVRVLLDVNGGGNDGIILHMDSYPEFDDFQNFDNEDNQILMVDVNSGTEEQVVASTTINVKENRKLGWLSKALGGNSEYNLMFWIEGYYTPSKTRVNNRRVIDKASNIRGPYQKIFDIDSYLNKNVEFVEVSILIDVNGGANDGILVYADGAPISGDFTNFSNMDRLLGFADVAKYTEEQVEMSTILPVVDGKVAWQIIPSSTASNYDVYVWLKGYTY